MKRKKAFKNTEDRGPRSRAEMLRVAGVVLSRMRRNPKLPARHLAAFARHFVGVLIGRSSLHPEPGDRRFNDEGWSDGRISKATMQIYLAAAQEITTLIREMELEGRDAASARFLAASLVDAIAPSNNPFLNPAVLRAARKSRGKTLVRGFYHLIGDQLDNNGLISMVDRSGFEVGRNVAATPGDVVFRNEVLELLQYTPTTEQVYARPLMIVPPQINKFYVLDLSPGNSLARHLVGQGFQVFMVSWRNPGPEQHDWGLEQYCDALEEAHAAVMEITGADSINWKGLCAGGLTSAITLARYAASRRLASVKSLTLNVTLLDIAKILDTNLGYFLTPEAMQKALEKSSTEGVLSGAEMSKMFAWVRPNDLVWNYWVNNYLMGKKPAAFDVLYWNSDSTRLPAALHADFIDLVDRNPFGHRESWKLGKATIDLKKVTVDQFVVAGRTDHITPWQGCYQTVNILGGKSEFVLVNSGHIQTLVSPPGKAKASYQTAKGKLPATGEEWLETSSQTQGSWWDHWTPWLAKRSGKKAAAPTSPGSQKYPSLGAAPGTYVKE